MAASTPFVYSFSDWDLFYVEVMNYHLATTKAKGRHIIDFIGTMRQFMDSEVIEHLGVLVNMHPRYATANGWEDWLDTVVALLQERDRTIDPVAGSVYITRPDLGKSLFASGNGQHGYALLNRWSALDTSVCRGTLTSTQQREILWANASPHEREVLLNACEYFDPAHEVWKCENEGDIKRAEQVICNALKLNESLHLNTSKLRQIKFWRRWVVTFVFLGLSLIFMTAATYNAAPLPKKVSAVPLKLGGAMLLWGTFAGFRLRALKRGRREAKRATDSGPIETLDIKV